MNTGIATLYKGIRFRSRLEARWAAFFDLMGWRYTYEPLDLAGWIPDFALLGEKGVTLVEVKPVFEFPVKTASRVEKAVEGSSNEVLLCGTTLHPKPLRRQDYDRVIGWLLDHYPARLDADGSETPAGHGEWADAVIGAWESSFLPFGFCHAEGQFHDRISGEYDGGCWGAKEPDLSLLSAYWNEAGNEVQWKRD